MKVLYISGGCPFRGGGGGGGVSYAMSSTWHTYLRICFICSQ